MREREGRLGGDGAAVERDGLLVPALVGEEEAEVVERGGVAGVQTDGLLVLAARLLKAARTVLEEAAVVVRRRLLGVRPGARRRSTRRASSGRRVGSNSGAKFSLISKLLKP